MRGRQLEAKGESSASQFSVACIMTTDGLHSRDPAAGTAADARCSRDNLRRVLKDYIAYFNPARSHQGIEQRIPAPQERAVHASGASGNVMAFPVLGGLHHDYQRAA